MPIPMPSAPPYAPLPAPPWIDEQPPPPPAPPAPPAPRPPRRRRGRAVALLVALSLLFGGIGVELGGALFGSPSATRPTAATATATGDTPTLPTVGTTPPASAGTNGGLTADEIAQKVDPSIVNITTTLANGTAAGTGMVLTPSGLVLTNNHVIADATEIRVQVDGTGPIYAATVVGYDITDDVAVIQMQGASNLHPISVGDVAKVAVRDHVVALGNALGKGGTPAIAQGSVTALDQTITAGDPTGPSQTLTGLIEINAPLVPGDSGGPLVNAAGDVIGMNAAASQQNRRGTSDAFAIPIDKALDIANQITSGQSSTKVHIGARALLGVQVQAGQGATVAGVQPGSPAESAGLVAGDVIVAVGNTTITSVSDVTAALNDHHPGDKVDIGWTDASGQHRTATVQLIEGPPA
jgi:S1-C subfamily serine protease